MWLRCRGVGLLAGDDVLVGRLPLPRVLDIGPAFRNSQMSRFSGGDRQQLALLEAFEVHYLILDKRRDVDLLMAVQADRGWALEFEDGESVLFSRTDACP